MNQSELKKKIVGLLNTVVPEKARDALKKKFKSDSRWVSESSSEWMSFGFLTWLVGPVERFDVEIKEKRGLSSSIPLESDEKTTWKSGVKVSCRNIYSHVFVFNFKSSITTNNSCWNAGICSSQGVKLPAYNYVKYRHKHFSRIH